MNVRLMSGVRREGSGNNFFCATSVGKSPDNASGATSSGTPSRRSGEALIPPLRPRGDLFDRTVQQRVPRAPLRLNRRISDAVPERSAVRHRTEADVRSKLLNRRTRPLRRGGSSHLGRLSIPTHLQRRGQRSSPHSHNSANHWPEADACRSSSGSHQSKRNLRRAPPHRSRDAGVAAFAPPRSARCSRS
jgi:hypothetical protein